MRNKKSAETCTSKENVVKTIKILHADHGLTEAHVDFLADKLSDKKDFFIEVLPLPAELPRLPAALYGPKEGDEYVREEEVTYSCRNGRPCSSRLVNRPVRDGNFVVCIGVGKVDEVLLFTAYGSVRGVAATREPGDTDIDSWEEVLEARNFWAGHALSSQG